MTRTEAKDFLRSVARDLFASCDPDNNPGRACPNWFEVTYGFDYERNQKARDFVRELGSDAFAVFHAEWERLLRAWLGERYPTAGCLLELWERPWSSTALRFAGHRLAYVSAHGLDVMA